MTPAIQNSTVLSGEIHLWAVDIEHLHWPVAEARQLLSLDEIDRADRFIRPQDTASYTVGRALLRKLVALYTGLDATRITFLRNNYGKLLLSKNSPSIVFNLSRSVNRILIGLGNTGCLGVDIEKIRQLSNQQELVERVFGPAGTKELNALSEQTEYAGFFTLWSRLEAITKALGRGLSCEAYQADSHTFIEQFIDLQQCSGQIYFPAQINYQDVEIWQNFKVCIAADFPIKTIQTYREEQIPS